MKKILVTLAMAVLLSTTAHAQILFDPPLDGQLRFPDTEVGQRSNIELVVTALQGVWRLRVAPLGDQFQIDPDGANISERESAVFILTFIPDEVGETREFLAILAQSPNGEAFVSEAELVGICIEGGEPQIEIDPEEIFLEINENQDSDFTDLTIQNTGDAGLHVSLRFDDPGWFEIRGEDMDVEIEPRDEYEFIIATTDDIPEDGEYLTNITVISDDPNNPRVFLPVHLTVGVGGVDMQLISLERGWNLISSNRFFAEDYVDEEGADMRLIFADIIDDIDMIKNQVGEFCSPDFDFWDIDAWEMDQAYQVKTNTATELQITGEPIPWDTEINLTAGWNLVAYYPDYETWGLQNGLAELIERDQLELAKDGQGRFLSPIWEFWGPDGIPGQGYQLKVTEDCSFHWAARQDGAVVASDRRIVLPPNHFEEPRPTDQSMSIIVRSIAGIEFREGAEIALITPRDEIGGMTVLSGEPSWGIAAWGDDGTTEQIEGFRDGEPVRFLYWDPVHDWELEIAVESDDEMVYHTNDLLVIEVTVGVDEETPTMPLDISLTDVFPNPFNSSSTVSYALTSVGEYELGLYSISGQLVKRIASGAGVSGEYITAIDGEDLVAGVYIVRLRQGGSVASKKVVLVK